jgi:hypothetical protein
MEFLQFGGSSESEACSFGGVSDSQMAAGVQRR